MRYLISGVLIGFANLVPGVSGGTVAVLTGVYRDLIISISSLFRMDWNKRALKIVGLTVVGALLAIGSGAMGLKRSLEYHTFATYAVFFGLVLGSLPSVLRKLERFHLWFVLVGIAVVSWPKFTGNAVELPSSPFMLIVGGLVAAGAMVLPGLSGSLLLLIMGLYERVIDAISAMDMSRLLPLGIGVIVGIVLFVKIVEYLMKTYPVFTGNFIVGLVVGSLLIIWPFGLEKASVGMGTLLIIVGAGVAMFVDLAGRRVGNA